MIKKLMIAASLVIGGTVYGQGAVEGGAVKNEGQANLGAYFMMYKLFGKKEINAYYQVDGEDNKYYKIGGGYQVFEDIKIMGGLGRAEYHPSTTHQVQVGVRVEFP